MQSTKLSPFSYQVFSQLKESYPDVLRSGQHWLLAVSGGVDSMVLLQLVNSWRTRTEIQLTVAHVHHGLSDIDEVQHFRKRAQELVCNSCQKIDVDFVTNVPENVNLQDEDRLREYRKDLLRRWKQEIEADLIVEAHHGDDLLETRLIRLIRGCSAEGLESMQIFSEPTLRPLLNFSKSSLISFAKEFDIEFVEDGSNRDTHFLRNWIRHQWLPDLESYRPGASEALSRSLQSVSQELRDSKNKVMVESTSFVDKGGHTFIDLSLWLALGDSEQIRDIARQMHSLGVHKFSLGQLKEIQKRLNVEQTSSVFKVAGVEWQVNAGQVKGQVCNSL